MRPKKSVFEYTAIVRRVYDGDTMYLDIDKGLGDWRMNEPIRLYGCNTPELRGKEREAGIISRDRVKELLPVGEEVTIHTFPDKGGRHHHAGRPKDRKGKYGRYLARIWVDALGDEPLDKYLIREGLGVEEYYGKKLD